MNPIKCLARWILRKELEKDTLVRQSWELQAIASDHAYKEIKNKFESYLRKKTRKPKERIKK